MYYKGYYQGTVGFQADLAQTKPRSYWVPIRIAPRATTRVPSHLGAVPGTTETIIILLLWHLGTSALHLLGSSAKGYAPDQYHYTVCVM